LRVSSFVLDWDATSWYNGQISGSRHRSAVRLADMQRRWFTWHMNAYRLIVGAIVLAIVIPASATGVKAMWLVALACVLVVTCAVVVGTRVPSIRDWLRH